MGSVIVFIPRAERTACGNLKDYIDFGRGLKALNAISQFDQTVWNVTDFYDEKGVRNIHWYAYAEPQNNKIIDSKELLSDPFLNFSKSYIVQYAALSSLGLGAISTRLKALKMLEMATRQMGHGRKVTDLNGAVFSRALEICQKNMATSSAYKLGGVLAKIAESIQESGLVSVPFTWHSNASPAMDASISLGIEGDLARANKLPSRAAIEGIAHIFHRCHTDSNNDLISRMATSICAILMSCPSRVSELLESISDLEVQGFSNNNHEYGLRWCPKKGGTPIVKPIPETLADVVKQAIASIREITEPARKLAIWYEQNPGKLYFYPDVTHLADRHFLNQHELGEVLWRKKCNEETVREFTRRFKISFKEEIIGKKMIRLLYSVDDIGRAVHSLLPHGFPFFGKNKQKRYSDMLFVHLGQIGSERSSNRCVLDHYNKNKLTRALSGGSEFSMFKAYGLTEADGSQIKANSHQFRHWLNTLMNAAGMSQLDIAMLSGRKDLRQNSCYNHLTPTQRVEQLRLQILDNSETSGRFTLPKTVIPITPEAYVAQQIPAAHLTDFGVCFHDYSQEPCQLHRDCLMCNDHICVKGDMSAERRLIEKLERTRKLLENAKKAMLDEEYGADQWVYHNTKIENRMTLILEKLQDPTISDGALIHLAVTDQPSRLKVALDQRVKIELNDPKGIQNEAKNNAEYIEKLNYSIKSANP